LVCSVITLLNLFHHSSSNHFQTILTLELGNITHSLLVLVTHLNLSQKLTIIAREDMSFTLPSFHIIKTLVSLSKGSHKNISQFVKLPKNWTRNILTKKKNYECNLANFAGAIFKVV
jgi:hypothetical protein